MNSPVYLIISGFIIDTTGCYTWAFFTAGIVTHVAGLVPLTLFCLKNKKDDDLKKDKTRKLLLWLTSFRKNNSFIRTFLSQTTTMTETTKKLSHNWCIRVSLSRWNQRWRLLAPRKIILGMKWKGIYCPVIGQRDQSEESTIKKGVKFMFSLFLV